MANNFEKILELATANNMGLSNTIKRDFGIPLDYTSVQENYDAAVIYAATSTLAYVGQTVAVGAKLYIISDVSSGKHTVGETSYDIYLAEVGSKTEGDGKTIELDGQTLKLAGLTGLDSNKTYVPSLINGRLVWAEPDTETAAGQQAAIAALQEATSEISATLNGDDTNPGLIAKVEDNASDITTEASARAEADLALEGKIAEALAEAKKYADDNDSVYDDTELANRTSAVEAAVATKANAIDVYDKTTIDNKFTEINNTISGITHFTTEVVTSTDDVTKVGVLYLIKSKDVEGKDNYDEYLYIEGQGAVLIGDTSTDLSNYVTNDALATAIQNFVTTDTLTTTLRDYALADTVSESLAGKANASEVVKNTDFEAFVTTNSEAIAAAQSTATADAVAQVEAKNYAVKSDKLSGYGITDAYTKDDVYTKAQVDDIVDSITASSSESAGSVKIALNSYINSIDTELYGADVVNGWTDGDGKYAPTYASTTSRLDTAISKAEAAQEQADKGVSDAAAAQTTANTANSLATSNKANIEALTAQITEKNSSVDASLAALTAQDTVIEGEISGLKTSTQSNATTIGNHSSRITALETKGAEYEGMIDANSKKFADYYNKNDIASLLDTKANSDSVYNKDEIDAALASLDQTEINAGIKANADAIAALVGDDTGKSIREIAAAEINTLIDAANSEDTITNINTLVTYVNENAGDISALTSAVEANTNKLEGLSSSVKDYVDSSIAAIVLPKTSTEINVGSDGTLGINEVNVNKLVQTEGEYIIMNGGTASGFSN